MASFDSDVIQPTDTLQGRTPPPVPLSDVIGTPEFQALPKADKLRAVNNFGAKFGQDVSAFSTVVDLAHDATQGSRKDIRDTAREMAAVFTDTTAKLQSGEVTPADAARQWFDVQNKTNERRAAGATERRRDLGTAQAIQTLKDNDVGFSEKAFGVLSGGTAPTQLREDAIRVHGENLTTPIEDLPNLTEDARRMNASGGVVHLTDGSLEVTDIAGLIGDQGSFEEMIKTSEASDSEKQRVLGNLPELRNEAIRQAWNAAAAAGNIILGDDGEPIVSPKASASGILGDAASDVRQAGLGIVGLDVSSRDEQREINKLAPQRFTLEEQEKAM